MEEQLEKYSFSRLSQFDNCFANYCFTYFLGQEKEENCYGQFGSFCHKILERWGKNEIEIYDLLTEYESGYDEAVTSDFPRLRNGLTSADKYYEEGYNFFANFDGIGDEYEIIGVEIEFEILVDDFLFVGKIDKILRSKIDGSIIPLDYKSKDGFKNEEEESEYRKQLYLYSLYILDKYKVYPSKTIFYCFRQQKLYEKSFDIDSFNEAVSWMKDTVNKIRKTFYCQYEWFRCNQICNFRHSCLLKRNVESNKVLKDFIKKEKKAKVEVEVDC